MIYIYIYHIYDELCKLSYFILADSTSSCLEKIILEYSFLCIEFILLSFLFAYTSDPLTFIKL